MYCWLNTKIRRLNPCYLSFSYFSPQSSFSSTHPSRNLNFLFAVLSLPEIYNRVTKDLIELAKETIEAGCAFSIDRKKGLRKLGYSTLNLYAQKLSSRVSVQRMSWEMGTLLAQKV